MRRDWNKFGGRIVFYITDQLPSQTITTENHSDIDILTIEIAICKNKILFVGIYKPTNLSETDFTTNLETIISKLSNKYESINPILSQFLDTIALSSLNIDPTYFKNSKNPSCINILLTNCKPSFMKTSVFKTAVSDHHKIISSITKLQFTRESPKTSYYRDYHKFDINYFSSELSCQLDSTFGYFKDIEDCEESNEFSRFYRVFQNLLNFQAWLKKQNLKRQQQSFYDKNFKKSHQDKI